MTTSWAYLMGSGGKLLPLAMSSLLRGLVMIASKSRKRLISLEAQTMTIGKTIYLNMTSLPTLSNCCHPEVKCPCPDLEPKECSLITNFTFLEGTKRKAAISTKTCFTTTCKLLSGLMWETTRLVIGQVRGLITLSCYGTGESSCMEVMTVTGGLETFTSVASKTNSINGRPLKVKVLSLWTDLVIPQLCSKTRCSSLAVGTVMTRWMTFTSIVSCQTTGTKSTGQTDHPLSPDTDIRQWFAEATSSFSEVSTRIRWDSTTCISLISSKESGLKLKQLETNPSQEHSTEPYCLATSCTYSEGSTAKDSTTFTTLHFRFL